MRHISARGRKLTLIALLLFIVLGMRHIPARGRKLVKRTVRTAQVADASHPRKGTEPQNCLCCHTATQDVSHPHQGTETYSSLSALHHPHHRCVTSPRGDGNTIALRVVLYFIGCVTSPPGDGNPVCQPMLLRTFPGCVTSPSPQGDENGISYSTGCSHAVDTSYPPQGDESLPKRSLPIALRRIRHIPARGRKRHSVQGFLDLVPRCTISPPGDGNTRRAGLAQ